MTAQQEQRMMEHDTRLRVALRFLILARVGVGMWALR